MSWRELKLQWKTNNATMQWTRRGGFRSDNAVDSEVRDPTAGEQSSGLSARQAQSEQT